MEAEQPDIKLLGYQGEREGHFRDRTPAIIPGVNMGSPVPREGKKSTEQQGAGDGCQTDRQWSHSIGWLTLWIMDHSFTLVYFYVL